MVNALIDRRKTVYVGLTLDTFHPGVFGILQAAASLGSVTVGLLTDRAVHGHKIPPAFSWEQREKMARAINGVANVVPQDEWSYAPNILKLQPDYFVHGNDWLHGPDYEIRDQVIKALSTYGGTLFEVDYTRGVSHETIEMQRRMNLSVPAIRVGVLKRSLKEFGFVRVIEAHSPLTAIVAEKAVSSNDGARRAFHALWSSSLADSALLGLPDNEVVDFSTRLRAVEQMLRASSLPFIFDGDTGGLIEHFVHRVRELERIGVAAIIIEDKRGLKRNSLIADHSQHQLEDPVAFSEKIRAGMHARLNSDFMIIARLESLVAGGSVSDCLSRAERYLDAGADGIMIHSKHKNASEVLSFARQFRQMYSDVPLVAVPTTYGQVKETALREAGFNVVIYANHMIRASYAAMIQVAHTILEHERASEADSYMVSIDQLMSVGNGIQ